MRISLLKNDPDYNANICWRSTVFLDETDVSGSCVVADDRQNFVLVYLLNKSGEKQFDQATGKVMLRELRGEVRIQVETLH